MRMNISKQVYFTDRRLNGMPAYGLQRTSERSTLDAINARYRQDIEMKPQLKEEKYIVVCVRLETHYDEEGNFLKRSLSEWVVANIEFSEEKHKFVFVY